MSGIAGIVRFDGAPIDRDLFDRLAASIRYRGPDGEASWAGEGAALAVTLLDIAERKPRVPSLAENDIVVAADARLDARDELIRALRQHGREVGADAPNASLVADAFAVWGEECPRHLLGDFSFAIWEPSRCRLFCARDRFGVRPFYYARPGESLIFSNDLSALLAIDGFASRWNDETIADFLLFFGTQDASRTTYAAIDRLQPAHAAVFDAQGMRTWRYWSLPVHSATRRIAEADAVEEFRHVFSCAVADRARAGRIALSLSGGIDSTAVAAMLVRSRHNGISAVTAGYESLIPDDEQRYAARAADSLGIPFAFHASDRHELFERWNDPRCRGLEPSDTPLRAAFIDLMGLLGQRGRVLLTGQGGDAVLYSSHAISSICCGAAGSIKWRGRQSPTLPRGGGYRHCSSAPTCCAHCVLRPTSRRFRRGSGRSW